MTDFAFAPATPFAQDLSSPRAPPTRFRPAAPDQPDRWPSMFDIFLGETSRNPLVGWPKETFDVLNRTTRVLHLTYHGISDPEGIKRVFLDNAANYPKPGLVRQMVAPAIGEGLFSAEGEAWRGQRRLMAPVFTPSALEGFNPTFVRVAKRTADRWAMGSIDQVDIAAEATRTTFEIIDEALFSGEAGLDFHDTAPHLDALIAATAEYRLGVLFGMPWLDQSAVQRRGARGRQVLLGQLTDFIARRQVSPAHSEDFMTRLLDSFAQHHEPKAAAKLALDNAATFFVAGHETTANGLAWAVYLLSRDPQAQAWAREESKAAWDAGGSPAEILARLPYLRMVWEETLRLYPPVPRMDRQALEDDEVCGQRVRKGDMISVWPWVVHRHRRLWNEPELFNPENFDPEAKREHHRFQYIPFGAGPRICIGMAFAQAEALLILSHWLSRFRFAPVEGHTVTPFAHATLKPLGGMPMRVERG
ncbi:cytochrome P450 [Phenylobacterium sp.]|uniref:cytochrome P450 n=1 Tax=Phenylobacterium sp. TaxID=1871053 RepID=UPI00286CE973|nr:cytochrome P450 [Phenylobacterium sp.]